MPMTAKAAADEIVASYEATVPANVRAGVVGKDFCSLWPQAKPILDLVSGIVILIPGMGQVAAGVLRGLIAVGDQIASEVCK